MDLSTYQFGGRVRRMEITGKPPIAAWVKARRLALGYATQEGLARAMGDEVSPTIR